MPEEIMAKVRILHFIVNIVKNTKVQRFCEESMGSRGG